MQQPMILLPALAALCYGAALPQAIVTGTNTLTAPTPVWTVVIPCYEAGCVVETVTLYDGDADTAGSFPISADLASYTIGLGSPTQTEEFGQGTTETGTILPRDPEPQSLGSVTNSETFWPWPWPTIITTTEIITVTVTELPTSSDSGSSTDVVSRSTSFYKRQSIISVSRTVNESPTPTSTTSSKKQTTSKSSKHHSSTTTSSHNTSSHTTSSHTTSKSIWPRQALGSPTRTVNLWPPWLWPTQTTITEIITETYTVYPTSTLIWPPSDISGLAVPRQALGSPTRTVEVWPPWWPTAITVTDIITETITFYPSSTQSTSKSLTLASLTSSTALIIPPPITPVTPTDSITLETGVDFIPTLTARQDLGIGAVGHTVTVGDQTTVSGVILPRQELVGTPTESVGWVGWGTGALPSATAVLEVPKGKRQGLWKPTRSFTSDGSTLSASATWFA